MKQIQSLRKSESGVIHHLGLFILGAIVLVGIGFAGYTVFQQNQNDSDAPITVNIEDSEDADGEQKSVTEDEFNQDVDAAQAEAEATEEVTVENL